MRKIIIKIFLLIFVCNSAYSQFATTCRQQQYQKESYTVFGAMTTLYNGDRKRIMDSLVFRLKRDTIWSTRDAIYMLANLDSNQAKINWKTPGTFNITTVATVTFTADQGYHGNGTTGYLKTGFIPFDSATHNFRKNNAELSLYSRTNSTSGVQRDLGGRNTGTATRTELAMCIGSLAYLSINDDAPGSVANTSTQGMFSGVRTANTGAGSMNLYKNGSVLSLAGYGSSVGLSTSEIYLGARSNDGGSPSGFTAKQYSFFSIGSSLSATKISSFNTDVEWYMDRLGSGVQ